MRVLWGVVALACGCADQQEPCAVVSWLRVSDDAEAISPCDMATGADGRIHVLANADAGSLLLTFDGESELEDRRLLTTRVSGRLQLCGTVAVDASNRVWATTAMSPLGGERGPSAYESWIHVASEGGGPVRSESVVTEGGAGVATVVVPVANDLVAVAVSDGSRFDPDVNYNPGLLEVQWRNAQLAVVRRVEEFGRMSTGLGLVPGRDGSLYVLGDVTGIDSAVCDLARVGPDGAVEWIVDLGVCIPWESASARWIAPSSVGGVVLAGTQRMVQGWSGEYSVFVQPISAAGERGPSAVSMLDDHPVSGAVVDWGEGLASIHGFVDPPASLLILRDSAGLETCRTELRLDTSSSDPIVFDDVELLDDSDLVMAGIRRGRTVSLARVDVEP